MYAKRLNVKTYTRISFFVWNQISKKFEKIKILNSAIPIIFLEVSFYENVLTYSKFIVIFN